MMYDPASKAAGRSSGRGRVRPDRSLHAVLVLALVTLCGAWALLPGTDEKAAGLFEDQRYGEAIGVLETAKQLAPLTSYGKQMLLRLYVMTAQPEAASDMIEHAEVLQDTDLQTLRQIVQLYRDKRDFAGEAGALRQLMLRQDEPQDRSRLRVLSRLLGDRSSEAALLADAIRDGSAAAHDIQRLAFLSSAPTVSDEALWVSPTGGFSELPRPALSATTSMFKAASE